MAVLNSSFPFANSALSPAACRAPYRPPRTGARVILGPFAEPVRCWSWRCEGCGFLKAKDATRLARLGITDALAAGLPLVFLTLTEPAVARPFGASSKALTSLMKRLQARTGGELRWMAVAEWQTRGAVHWHVVVAGLVYTSPWTSEKGRIYPGHSREQVGHRVRKEADLRPIVERYGFGAVFNIHAVGVAPDDTAEEIASYLSKYLTKGGDMARLPKGSQPVRTSRCGNQWSPGNTLTSLCEERCAAVREQAAEAVA